MVNRGQWPLLDPDMLPSAWGRKELEATHEHGEAKRGRQRGPHGRGVFQWPRNKDPGCISIPMLPGPAGIY
jgi:hypothetical protein